MSITVRDCLNLPSLSKAKLLAGRKGIESIVKTISVIEFDDFTDKCNASDEIVITSFYHVKDDINMQCKSIEHAKEAGDVAIIIFYSDIILSGLDNRLIETAETLDFPLIVLPEDNFELRYCDVISEVMEAIILDRQSRGNIPDYHTLAKKIFPIENKLNYWHLSLAKKCRNMLINESYIHIQEYLDLLSPLKESCDDLLNTLSIYLIDADSNLKKASELCFLHRNTVTYRLNKAKEILGGDFTHMPFKGYLYFSLVLERAVS